MGPVLGLFAADLGIGQGRHDQILHHRHAIEQARHLKGASNPAAGEGIGRHASHVRPIQRDRTFVGLERSRHQIDGRSLAGAIRTDQADEFAALQFDRQILDRIDTAKMLVKFAHGEIGSFRRG